MIAVGYGTFVITDTSVKVRVLRAGKTSEHEFRSLSAALRFCDENLVETCKVDEVEVEGTVTVRPTVSNVEIALPLRSLDDAINEK
jgi:hypothetical protein